MLPHYTKILKKFANSNRSNSTFGERRLWKHLKSKQMMGMKFRRQYIFDKYIIDFYCIELKLGIEIDGSSHDDKKYEYDKVREEYLISKEVNILRFTEYDVMKRTNDVLQTIELKIESLIKA